MPDIIHVLKAEAIQPLLADMDAKVGAAQAAVEAADERAQTANTEANRSQTEANRSLSEANRAASEAGRAEMARDAAQLSRGLWPTTASGIGPGVAGVAEVVPGSDGTDGTFDLSFTGGTQVIAPAGHFTVVDGSVVAVVITYPGHYSAGVPTLGFAASAGLTGAGATAIMAPNTAVGGYFSTPSEDDNSALALYRVDAGPVATLVASYPTTELAMTGARADGLFRSKTTTLASLGHLSGSVALLFLDERTDRIAGWIDNEHRLYMEAAPTGRQRPVAATGVIPGWGVELGGQFVGFDVHRQLQGRIDEALGKTGLVPHVPAAGFGVALELRDRNGETLFGVRETGGITDPLASQAAHVVSEWLRVSDGVQVAPFAEGAVECVVAYLQDGTRRVLTEPFPGVHYRNPQVVYGGVSVRCVRITPERSEIVAVSIEEPGFIVSDDPRQVWLFAGWGQSLATGSQSHLPLDWPWRKPAHPRHTLTLNSRLRPGDIRLGRNASYSILPEFVQTELVPDDLTGLTPIKPQIGVVSVHGLTPIEAMMEDLQERIVRLIGRPQRMIGWTCGLGGAQLSVIGVDTIDEANQKLAMEKAVQFAREQGWTPVFRGLVAVHGESDAAAVSDVYEAGKLALHLSLDAHAQELTGQGFTMPLVMAQPSSFFEGVDDEVTRTSIIGMIQLMESSPADTVVAGPDYGLQEYFAPDMLHFTAPGSHAKGQMLANAVRWINWGGRSEAPLRLVSATISGATITATWSEPVEQDLALPSRPHMGIEVATGANTFVPISIHTLAGNVSTIVLETVPDPGEVATMTVQVAMKGHAETGPLVRDAATVPTSNIRSVRVTHHDLQSGKDRHKHAVHQRIQVTAT